jgi:pyrroline-5-carboxylate reductase
MEQKTVVRINEEVLKNTSKCKKDFSCLAGMSLCQVELNVGDKIHFVKCMSNEPCNYRISFGYSFVCLCPVRKELFNRYNI